VKKDLTGMKFGRLTVMWPAGLKGKNVVWMCSCECGSYHAALGYNLTNGHTQSCGCLLKELLRDRIKGNPIALSHGQARNGRRTPEYQSYISAKDRCNNPNTPSYEDYGGRGIQLRFNSFEEWFAELGPKPEPKHLYSVNRINNDGHYEIGNVEWTTAKEQIHNRRPRRARRKEIYAYA
jgi:hypothetical protein